MSPPFLTDLAKPTGEAVAIGPSLTRVLANNAGPFTYTGTGTYILGNPEGRDQSGLVIVDPGPDDNDHLAALIKSFKGQKVAAILITHTHLDHSPLSKRLKAATGAIVYGFGPHNFGQSDRNKGVEASYKGTEAGGDTAFVPDICVKDGDILKIGNHRIKVFHTPGHTSNHICYLWQNHHILFTGDHIMGWSTTVIAPPDGNMALYIESLEKLLTVECRALYPTHGPPLKDPKNFIRHLIEHRLTREAQIVTALKRSDHSVAELVQKLYPKLEQGLRIAASQSVISHLIKLKAEGKITYKGVFSLSSDLDIHLIG